jgi:hypothetical protein
MLLQLLRSRWHSAMTGLRSGRRARHRRELSARLALVDVLEDRTMPSVITVTNLRDSGGGSLRAAVASANAHPGADVIRVQANLAGTIVLTGGQMEITGALAIDGPGPSRLTISGNNASRVFKMGPGIEVSIDDLTIADARNTTQDNVGIVVTRGGAILNDGGELHLTRVAMLNNRTIDAGDGPASQVVGGGAVVNSGNATLTARQCRFIGNTAGGGTSYAFGGAIGNVTNSVADIEDCAFVGNVATAGGTSYGGAIGNFGSSRLTVTGCTFDGNAARGTDPGEEAFGGAIATRPGTVVSSGSTTAIDRSVFHDNRAVGGAGGAGQSGGDAGGGALYNVASTLFVRRSWFVGNEAIGGDGGSSGGSAFGGAIDATAVNPAEPPLTRISQCQFVGNLALSGSSDSGSGGLAAGGALSNASGRMDLTRSRVVGNVALGGRTGQGIGGGIYNLATVTADLRTLHSIAGNVASTSNDNVYGPVTVV